MCPYGRHEHVRSLVYVEQLSFDIYIPPLFLSTKHATVDVQSAPRTLQWTALSVANSVFLIAATVVLLISGDIGYINNAVG